jgi:hypothetical protein
MPGHTGSHNADIILPRDLLEIQLGQIDLLSAMYESEDAVSIEDTTRALVEDLKEWCSGDSEAPPQLVPPSIQILLTLHISPAAVNGVSLHNETLELDLSVPLVRASESETEPPNEPPPVKIRIRRPAWMSKTEASQITAETPQQDDLFAAVEHVKEAASVLLSRFRELEGAAAAGPHKSRPGGTHAPMVRVWFYFPSISTRSKRDDLIIHAPTYGLTGFLLAGKPGILCVEGVSQSIDEYMKFIKTESWGDIPAHHKKVSERYRETGSDVTRAFVDMQEITDLVGERRGERANRGDMKALELWLGERGLGDALTTVLM